MCILCILNLTVNPRYKNTKQEFFIMSYSQFMYLRSNAAVDWFTVSIVVLHIPINLP